MNEKVKQLLMEQIVKEFYSAYLYLDMSNYYFDKNLDGFGNWFRVQAQEERDHAMLFMQYLLNNSIPVKLGAIAAPEKVYENFREPLEAALIHEQYVTSSINDIYSAAAEVRDYRTMQFLDWFIKEQGEEEQNANDLVGHYDLFGGDSRALFMYDAELAQRVYTAPSLVL